MPHPIRKKPLENCGNRSLTKVNKGRTTKAHPGPVDRAKKKGGHQARPVIGIENG
jgi:hypothetical protein